MCVRTWEVYAQADRKELTVGEDGCQTVIARNGEAFKWLERSARRQRL